MGGSSVPVKQKKLGRRNYVTKSNSRRNQFSERSFKNSINYSLVKIHNGSYITEQPPNSGMTPNGEIYASGAAYKSDYGIETPDMKAFFIHESTHVWQYQNNILFVKTSAALELVTNFFNYDAAYYYKLEKGKTLIDYKIEQQAMIVEDYYKVVKRSLDFSSRVQNGGTKTDKKTLLQSVMADFINDPTMKVR